MVADALIYHPTLSHYLRFVATTVGRDKLLRTIQYFSRFYAWYLFRTNAKTTDIQPFEILKKQFGLTRKALRLGKNIEHIKAAATAYDRKDMDPVLRYLAIGRQLGYAFYLTFDAIGFFNTIKVREIANPKLNTERANKAWAFGISCNVIAGLYTLFALQQREAAVNKSDGEGVVEYKKVLKERSAARIQLISDCCDLANPATGLGYTSFDDGVIGLAGTTSSLIGVWNTWKKTA